MCDRDCSKQSLGPLANFGRNVLLSDLYNVNSHYLL